MSRQRFCLATAKRHGAALAAVLLAAIPTPGMAQTDSATQTYGLAVKRPVVQAACRNCPWGQLAEILKRIMAPAYDIAICYSCFGENGVRIVSNRLIAPEITDRMVAQGSTYRPDARIDFGITTAGNIRAGYFGEGNYKKDGPMKNLRHIARIESPSYLLVAIAKESGITDLRQISDRKMPVRLMIGNGGELVQATLAYYGITEKDVKAWGGKILAGTAMFKNPDFDVIIGVGTLSNYPEGNMWYEMSQRKDLVFTQIPEELRQKLVKDNYGVVAVELPFRYLRGVRDDPHPTVGVSGHNVYGRDDLPDQFVRDIATRLDEQRGLLKWASQPFSYDSATVWDGSGVLLHPAAERYYRERGYMRDKVNEARQ